MMKLEYDIRSQSFKANNDASGKSVWIKKIEALKKLGVRLTREYDQNSELELMKHEYTIHYSMLHDDDKKILESCKDVSESKYFTNDELNLKKKDLLYKLNKLVEDGAKLSQHYSMDSDYNMMKVEYELYANEVRCNHRLSWWKNSITGLFEALETLNAKYTILDIHTVKHYSTVLTSVLNDSETEHILKKIDNKYALETPRKMCPELKLFLLCASAIATTTISLHLANQMKKSQTFAEHDYDFIHNLRQKDTQKDTQIIIICVYT